MSKLHMKRLAAAEVVLVFVTIVIYIWRWQYVYPDVPIYTLAFIVASFFVRGDTPQVLGMGSRGFFSTLRSTWRPTLIAAVGLIFLCWMTGSWVQIRLTQASLNAFGRYFAWCLFQQFGLQSFFSNRLIEFIENPNRAAWLSAGIFAAFHLPNPVLIPVTFFGGYFLARLFLQERNILPLALAQAIIGILLSVALPASWHHGLRVGPGYYRR